MTISVAVKRFTTERDVLRAFARCSVDDDISGLLKRDDFLLRAYLSEHSPIRAMIFWIEIDGISDRVHTHLIRHHVGFQPYVRTQRPDRGGKEGTRDISIQLNAQSLINMAQQRLCLKAYKDTRDVVRMIRDEVGWFDQALAKCMVPKCVYRGGLCGEMQPCKHKARQAIMEQYHYYFDLFEDT